MSTQVVTLLSPRPYARGGNGGRLLLLPLLPPLPEHTKLPSELWYAVFLFLCGDKCGRIQLRRLLRVSKLFRDIALPLVYEIVETSKVSQLQRLASRVHKADSKWDSLRRYEFSAPGRWIRGLDLSELPYTTQADALLVDTILTHLFALVPYLTSLVLNPSFTISRRALKALAQSDCVNRLSELMGIFYAFPTALDDPLVELLTKCPMLKELDLVGPGAHFADHDTSQLLTDVVDPQLFTPLDLPQLHTISMLGMPSSSPMNALLVSRLPCLRKLTVTPYDDIPYPLSLTTQFIATHGSKLRSLCFITPNSWPSRRHPSPTSLLETCPNLHHLSLERPIPQLTLSSPHPLKILSVPRPNAEAWSVLDRLFRNLPSLCMVRTSDVRWLRTGLTSKAQEAGVQGEMKEWTRRLSRRRIRLVDTEWKSSV